MGPQVEEEQATERKFKKVIEHSRSPTFTHQNAHTQKPIYTRIKP